MAGAEAIGVYQYAFGQNQGLLHALKSPIHSSFGLSKDEKRRLVIPCMHTIPHEGTQFEKSYQTLFKTCQYYMQEWTDPENTKELIKTALKDARTELARLKFPELLSALHHYQIASLLDDKKYIQITEQIHKDLRNSGTPGHAHAHQLIRFFLEKVLLPRELKVYLEQLFSTSTTLMHKGRFQLGMSGTSEGSSGWSDHFVFKEDLTQLPKIFAKAINAKTIALDAAKLTSKEAIIKEVTSLINEAIIVIIDVGSVLRGISTIEVARSILAQSSSSNEVLYYATAPNGLSEHRILLRDGTTHLIKDGSRVGLVQFFHDHGLLAERSPFPLVDFEKLKIITYYDQAHVRGSDIPQIKNAAALLLDDGISTATDLKQAIMRLRLYLQDQWVIWVYLSKNLEKKLEAPDLINHAERREDKLEKINFAQSLLNSMHFYVMDYLSEYIISPEGEVRENAVGVAKALRNFLVDRSISKEYFSSTLSKEPTYLEKIDARLEELEKLIQQLVPYGHLEELIKMKDKIKVTIEENRTILKDLGSVPTHEGIKEQELQQELLLEQLRREERSCFYEFNPTIGLSLRSPNESDLSPVFSKEKIAGIYPINQLSPPKIISSELFLSSQLFLRVNSSKELISPWLGYSFPIETVFIYSIKNKRSRRSGKE